jgi:hypothetical protein
MGKYGESAIRAVGFIADHSSTNPEDAWKRATAIVFADSQSSRDKTCPRGAFLGLCDVGAVAHVPPGAYTDSVENKAYAIRALDALRSNPELADHGAELWRIAVRDQPISRNGQIDVLLGLWQSGLIKDAT